MYSVFKNNLVLGLMSALIVGFLLIVDYRRKGESVDASSLFKVSGGVFSVVTLVTYLSTYLHGLNKQIGGVKDIEVDTGLPKF